MVSHNNSMWSQQSTSHKQLLSTEASEISVLLQNNNEKQINSLVIPTVDIIRVLTSFELDIVTNIVRVMVLDWMKYR